ncbi:hypothetical protein CH267_12985 [Rhodococcus sp. 06-621-2]|nr:WhiB family transcriptional regulator [Rhodococcus sp. 06-621-2]OZC55488.1 hypothetical protein CH267_12985 [Rhodococcus sp. 06-621-2]
MFEGRNRTAADWNWQLRAACRASDINMFYETASTADAHERGNTGDTTEAIAKTMCARCLVQENCLLYAIESAEEHGIWGGMNLRERKKWKWTHYVPTSGYT